MGQKLEYDVAGGEVYLAGEKVLPGRYKQMGGGREVLLEAEDVLPASLDGQVAVYMRVNQTWGEIAQHAVVR